MASRYGSSYQKASDIEYDYNCTRCEQNDHNTEALFYCTNCCKLYCDPCVKLHGSFYTDHNVLGKKDVDKWGVARREVSMEMCEEHRGKELDMYCQEHNAVCCYVCLSVNHRTCKRIDHVPDVAKGIHQKTKFKKLAADMSKMMKQLNEISAGRKRNQKTLQDNCKNIISSLTSLITTVYKLMEKLQKKTIETMDKLLAELDETLQHDVDACMAIHNKMKKLLDTLQDMDKKKETLAFVVINKSESKLSKAKHLVQSMPTQQYKITFTDDLSIEQFLSSLETLGTFETSPSHTGAQSPYKTGQIPPTSTDAKLPANTDQIYAVVDKRKYNVRITGDKKTPNITGCCQMPNGQTVICDYVNNKVKLLNQQYNVISHCNLPPSPRDVCHIAGTDLAVTVCDSRHEIQLINAGNDQLAPTRTIALDHDCSGLAHHAGQLYVGTPNALHVYRYTMGGQLVKQLYEDTSDRRYTTITRFAISDNGQTIYVSNFDKHLLITLDNNGRKLATLADNDMQRPKGVCLAGNGTVFVSGQDSNTVVQVSWDGEKKLATIATNTDGVKDPRSLWFNRYTSDLIVGKANATKLLVLKLLDI